MPDIVTVSDSLNRSKQDNKWIPQFVFGLNDSVTKIVGARGQQNISRVISESVAITETIQVYKNDELVLPPIPPAGPEVPNIIGFRQQKLRALRRPPRAILIEATLTNIIASPLKLLAFTDTNNIAIVGIRLELNQNLALSATKIPLLRSQLMIVQSSIKTQPQAMTIKSQLALPSSPGMRATCSSKLKTKPEVQTIHALKAVNFEKMHKLVKIMKIAMLAEEKGRII